MGEFLGFPISLHLLERLFDVEFLVGFLTDILTKLTVLKKSSINARLECETLNGSNVTSQSSGYLIPMSVNHTVFSEGNSNWYNWFEFIYFFFNSCCNCQNTLKTLFVSELRFSSSDSLEAILKGLLKLFSIEILPIACSPGN
jgi:hypothetical protein